MTEVTISANVASIGELAFGGCTRIKNVYAYPLVPPVLETSSFDVYVNDNATLHVVENCKSAYEKASAWRYFLLIVEDLEVGSGVQDAWAQNSSVRAYGDNGDIVVTGCNEGDCIAIYNSCGSMLHAKNAADNTVRISINAGGIYLVKVGDAVMRVLL